MILSICTPFADQAFQNRNGWLKGTVVDITAFSSQVTNSKEPGLLMTHPLLELSADYKRELMCTELCV